MPVSKLLTADDLFAMPDDGYHKHELVAGRLVTMAPAGFLHGVVGMRLGRELAEHVRRHRLGLVIGPDTGFKLESDPDTVRAPDVAFIAKARLPAGPLPVGFWIGAPDLAVEVWSPTDRRSELAEKIAEYLRCGVDQVWFVDPFRRRMTVHRAGVPPRVLGETDTLDGGDLLPGFSYPLSELFSDRI